VERKRERIESVRAFGEEFGGEPVDTTVAAPFARDESVRGFGSDEGTEKFEVQQRSASPASPSTFARDESVRGFGKDTPIRTAESSLTEAGGAEKVAANMAVESAFDDESAAQAPILVSEGQAPILVSEGQTPILVSEGQASALVEETPDTATCTKNAPAPAPTARPTPTNGAALKGNAVLEAIVDLGGSTKVANAKKRKSCTIS
jgi:hypothetical protein